MRLLLLSLLPITSLSLSLSLSLTLSLILSEIDLHRIDTLTRGGVLEPREPKAGGGGSAGGGGETEKEKEGIMLRTNVASHGMRGLGSGAERPLPADGNGKTGKLGKITKAGNRTVYKFFRWLATRSGIEKLALIALLLMLVRGKRHA